MIINNVDTINEHYGVGFTVTSSDKIVTQGSVNSGDFVEVNAQGKTPFHVQLVGDIPPANEFQVPSNSVCISYSGSTQQKWPNGQYYIVTNMGNTE